MQLSYLSVSNVLEMFGRHCVAVTNAGEMSGISLLKAAFHDTDTDTDILAMIVARMSVSVLVSLSAAFTDNETPALTEIWQ